MNCDCERCPEMLDKENLIFVISSETSVPYEEV